MKTRIWKYVGWTAGTLTVAGLVVACVGAIRATATTGPQNDATSDSFKADGDIIQVDNDAIPTAGIRTLTVEAKDVPVTLTLTGRTGFDMEAVAHVHAQFGGKVKEVGPQLGAVVNGPDAPGGPTVLCVIESNDLAQAKSNYLQAKVQLKLDQDNLARTKELVKSTVLADKFLLDAESAVAKSNAALEAARQQLLVFGLTQKQIDEVASQQGRQRMDYVITSPRSGVVAEKGVSGGEVADPTVNLFTIADTSTMWVWGDVYERDLRRIKIGQTVRIVFTSDPDRPRECKIDWISPVLDPNTHSVRVRGTLENKDGHLLADMYGTMVVTVDEGKNSILLPSDCVVREGTDSYVFVEVGQGGNKTRFRRTKLTAEPVDVGFGVSTPAVAAAIAEGGERAHDDEASSARVRIKSGVRPGDRVVQSGALGLFNEIEQQSKP
jgi:cobalt-zinc-cadmium efflux system membrane fusion protein